MFGKLFKKKKESNLEHEDKQLTEYISKIGITEMKTLLLGQIDRFKVDEEMIVEVMKKLTYQDEKTNKRFLESDDNDIKLKKAFDTVITAANSKKISVAAVELIEKFIIMYRDLIESYDKRNKQIYMHKLTNAIKQSISFVEKITKYISQMAVINKD